MITTEGQKNIPCTPRTLPRRQRPQRHQPSWPKNPNLLVKLNLRTLYLQLLSVGVNNDSLGSLGAAFSELHVRTPEGKAKEEYTGGVGAEDNPEGEHVRTDDVPSGGGPLGALQTQPSTLQHPLLRPLHFQLHIQQHALLHPLHLWLRAQALLACLTQPMVWSHPQLSHLWHIQFANLRRLAHHMLVFSSQPPVLNFMPIIGACRCVPSSNA